MSMECHFDTTPIEIIDYINSFLETPRRNIRESRRTLSHLSQVSNLFHRLVQDRLERVKQFDHVISSLRAAAPSMCRECDLLAYTVAKNDVVAFATLLKAGFDPNQPNRNGVSARQYAQHLQRQKIISCYDTFIRLGPSQLPGHR